MTLLLDQRDDGSLALYIDGDLQFDSRDESIYHEALALPALALAERRHPGALSALICGGGDGLVARELLKSRRLARLTLVDYDPTILDLAVRELALLNGGSLADPRLTVQVDDAWRFVESIAATDQRYDLIIVDLTLPRDLDGARFQTIDWYRHLGRLLGPAGLLAVNGASPTARADAFWSIYNSLRGAGLAARPYRIALPSFTRQGYGPDWGFLLASAQVITRDDLDDSLPLATPRQALRDAAHLRQMLRLPTDGAQRRLSARPTELGSDLLLHYLYEPSPADQALAAAPQAHDQEAQPSAPQPPTTAVATDQDPSIRPVDTGWSPPADDPAPLPPPDRGRRLLPPSVRQALAGPVGSHLDEETLFQRVIGLMPGLHTDQTRSMVAEFLSAPATFLASLDLPGLVNRLLRRAAELPRRLVVELRLLRARLRHFTGDYEGLLRLGLRIVTVVTLVAIIANLLYPDAVYGKGGTSSGPSSGGHATNLAQPSRNLSDPSQNAPDLALGGGYRTIGRAGVAVDESGAVFPARRYVYYHGYAGHRGYSSHRAHQVAASQPAEAPIEDEAPYRLTPDTDILADGRVAITLGDGLYLLIDNEVAAVTNQTTGQPLLFLERDPAQVWHIAKEMERQRTGLIESAAAKQAWIDWVAWLQFAHWRGDDEIELRGLRTTADRLERARFLLGPVAAGLPAALTPPVANAVEIVAGVWMLPDASGLVVRQPDGISRIDGKGWYEGTTRDRPRSAPYPDTFVKAITILIAQQIRDQAATDARLQRDLVDEAADLTELLSDKTEYDQLAGSNPPTTLVEYGVKEIPLAEAQRLTNDSIARTQARIRQLNGQRDRLPQEIDMAKRLLQNLQG